MDCPMCGAKLSVDREDTGTTWFTGRYCCRRHGLMRITGQILNDGQRRPYHFIPACRNHNFSAMTQVTDSRWLCMACDEEVRLIHGRFQRFRPIKIEGRRALWAM